MAIEPGDELGAGRGHLRASHADREHVIGTLKAAFVQGMLTKDEFDLRAGTGRHRSQRSRRRAPANRVERGRRAESTDATNRPSTRPGLRGCVGVLSHRTPLARLIEGDELLAAAAVPLRTTTG
jgi:hypothetical protein